MKTTLVTGSSGFIGGHLCKKLLEKDYRVVGIVRDISKQTTLNKLGIADKIILCHGNMLDKEFLERVLVEYRPDQIYHLAAQSIVSRALKIPADTFSTNVTGTACLLEACQKVHMPKAINIFSTDKIYAEGMNKTEEDIPASFGIYEGSKIAEEIAAQSFMNAFNMPIIISRSCNIFGEYDDNIRIIPNTFKSITNNNSPIIYSGDDSLREYIYVEDVCNAIIILMENIDKTKGYIFNIGSGDVINQEDLVKLMIEISGRNISPIYVKKSSLPEIHQQSVNSNKIRKWFGWANKYNLNEGLKKIWEIEYNV